MHLTFNDRFGEIVLHCEIAVNVSTGMWSPASLQPHQAALSAIQSLAGWVSPFLGQWPVFGNCPSDFAPAAKINSPRNLVSQPGKSIDRFRLDVVIREPGRSLVKVVSSSERRFQPGAFDPNHRGSPAKGPSPFSLMVHPVVPLPYRFSRLDGE